MFQTCTTFLHIDGKLYQIIRQIRESHKPIVETWQEHLRADKVFKKDEYYFFVREVAEAEVLEEKMNN